MCKALGIVVSYAAKLCIEAQETGRITCPFSSSALPGSGEQQLVCPHWRMVSHVTAEYPNHGMSAHYHHTFFHLLLEVRPPHVSVWSFERKVMGWGVQLERGTSYLERSKSSKEEELNPCPWSSCSQQVFLLAAPCFVDHTLRAPMNTPILSGHSSRFSLCD